MIDMTQLFGSQLVSTGKESSSAKGQGDEEQGTPFMMLVAQMLLQSDNDEPDEMIPLKASEESVNVSEDPELDESSLDLSTLNSAREIMTGFQPIVSANPEEMVGRDSNDAAALDILSTEEQASVILTDAGDLNTAEEDPQQTENPEMSVTKFAGSSSVKDAKGETSIDPIADISDETQLSAVDKKDLKADVEMISKFNLKPSETDSNKAGNASMNDMGQRTGPTLPNQNLNIQQSATRTEHAQQMLDIPVETTKPEWSEQFNQQIVLMGTKKIDSAQIKLNPPEMGPLDVMVKMDKQNAHLTIQSHSLHVRDMIEQSVPRLREMMAEQGLNLTDVNIGARQEQAQDQGRYAQEQMSSQQANMLHSGSQTDAAEANTIVYRSKGLIDYFA